MPGTPSPRPLRRATHSVQFVEVALDNVQAAKRARRDQDPVGPWATIPRARLVRAAEDGTEFVCRIIAVVRTPVTDSQTWRLRLVLDGRFIAERGLTPEEIHSFQENSAVFVLWPYARSMIGELAAHSGIQLPPLPLIVRPSAQRFQISSKI